VTWETNTGFKLEWRHPPCVSPEPARRILIDEQGRLTSSMKRTIHSVSAGRQCLAHRRVRRRGATPSLTVPDGRPLDIRSAVQERLETAAEDAALR